MRTAPLLDIVLDEDDRLPATEASRLYEEGADDMDPLVREKVVFLTLWEATKASIENESAIWFH